MLDGVDLEILRKVEHAAEHVESERFCRFCGLEASLLVMTELWNESTDFRSWYYACDPTHVVFYSQKTLAYICQVFGIRQIAGDGKRVFVFQKD